MAASFTASGCRDGTLGLPAAHRSCCACVWRPRANPTQLRLLWTSSEVIANQGKACSMPPQVSAQDNVEPFRCSSAAAALLVVNMTHAAAAATEHAQVDAM